jgi:hypothetical protein
MICLSLLSAGHSLRKQEKASALPSPNSLTTGDSSDDDAISSPISVPTLIPRQRFRSADGPRCGQSGASEGNWKLVSFRPASCVADGEHHSAISVRAENVHPGFERFGDAVVRWSIVSDQHFDCKAPKPVAGGRRHDFEREQRAFSAW